MPKLLVNNFYGWRFMRDLGFEPEVMCRPFEDRGRPFLVNEYDIKPEDIATVRELLKEADIFHYLEIPVYKNQT